MGCSCSIPRVAPLGFIRSRSKDVVRIRARARSIASIISSHLGINKDNIHWPFQEREVLTLLTTWDIVRENLDKKGADMFAKMFQESPGVKSVFEKFNSLDPSGGSEILYIHGMTVMNAIDDVMCNLDDKNVAIEMILEQGQNHAHFGDQVNESIFWAIEQPFLKTAEESLGRKYKPELKRMYEKAIRFIVKNFILGFMEAKERVNRGPLLAYGFSGNNNVSTSGNSNVSISHDDTELQDLG